MFEGIEILRGEGDIKWEMAAENVEDMGEIERELESVYSKY